MKPIVYVFGAIHHAKAYGAAIEKDIRKIEPDIILHELLYEDICRSKADIQNRLTLCRHRAKCDPRINKDVYQLGLDLDAILIGIDSDNPRLHRMQQHMQYRMREQHMLSAIKEHVEKDYARPTKIIIVVNDIHLRTKRFDKVPFASSLHEYFKGRDNVKVKRVPMEMREVQ